MSNQHVNAQLDAYIARELPPAQHEAVRQHLLTCEACRDEEAILRALRTDLSAALRQEGTPTAPQIDAMWANIRAAQAEQPKPRPALMVPIRLRVALTPLVVGLVLLITPLLLGWGVPPAVNAAQTQTVIEVPADGVTPLRVAPAGSVTRPAATPVVTPPVLPELPPAPTP